MKLIFNNIHHSLMIQINFFEIIEDFKNFEENYRKKGIGMVCNTTYGKLKFFIKENKKSITVGFLGEIEK